MGEIYNVGGGNELSNVYIVREILKRLNKPKSLIHYVKDRPGHDRRYAIDFNKIQNELGWLPRVHFSDGLDRTIDWYKKNLRY